MNLKDLASLLGCSVEKVKIMLEKQDVIELATRFPFYE